ncbi:Na+ dependent nucleoside transporter C-terminus-domain-containing protein [Coniella lustricola]|uniref:Na+ dependent nucleoside transporter C-terminus-domain-containing protein n=1 Tax=Coniella lustricola TaxID=2025994 RepID=A0A2T3A380_9PEZI|nr:Na+ dependent nucleoside transporter C-terminus-domain-containing protein [Coniella lustricola]
MTERVPDQRCRDSHAIEHDAERGPSQNDIENGGGEGNISDEYSKPGSTRRRSLKKIYLQCRLPIHFLVWAVWTAWWVFGLVHYRNSNDLGWLKPTLVYICITLRILTLWMPARVFFRPIELVWHHTALRVYTVVPPRLHQPCAALASVAIVLTAVLAPPDNTSSSSSGGNENTRANRAISLFGLAVMVALLTATSRDWRRIPWHTVIGGMLGQFLVALFVLRTHVGYEVFSFISSLARTLLGFAEDGVAFLTTNEVASLSWFLVGVVPPIVFFVSLVQMLFYLGLLQWFIRYFSVIFFWSLRVSGAEAVVAAATPFIGQGESAMLIRPLVSRLTLAELHQVMVCGFATISGSVLVAYVGLGLDAQALVSSCVMSIPASLAVSKMRFPETDETLTGDRAVDPLAAASGDGTGEDDEQDGETKATNALHAFAKGAWLGIRIAGMVVSTLLCIIALVSLCNGVLTWWGKYWGLGLGLGLGSADGGRSGASPPLTLELILGYLLYPVAWLLGVPGPDVFRVAQLVGIKIVENEYVAFNALTTQEVYANMGARSKLIATYACCGFGNFGSLGTQIGVLTQLAPRRAGDVSRVALSALFSGVLATLTSASVAGMLYNGS